MASCYNSHTNRYTTPKRFLTYHTGHNRLVLNCLRGQRTHPIHPYHQYRSNSRTLVPDLHHHPHEYRLPLNLPRAAYSHSASVGSLLPA